MPKCTDCNGSGEGRAGQYYCLTCGGDGYTESRCAPEPYEYTEEEMDKDIEESIRAFMKQGVPNGC